MTGNSNKYILINNYFTCQRTKCSLLKTQSSRLDKKQKQEPIICCLQEPYIGQKAHTDWKWGSEKIFHANGNDKKTGVAILISDKIDI